jgi:two-component system, response regulator PdtaR
MADVTARVLLVEDDALVRFALTAALAEAGIVAIEARNSVEALSMLTETEGIRMVITDIDMPGSINGLGLVRLLEEGHPYLRIIIISGHPLPKDIKISDDIAYIQKPFSFDQLTTAIQERLQ